MRVAVFGGAGGIALGIFHNAGAHADFVQLAVFYVIPLQGFPCLDGHIGILPAYPAVADGVRYGSGEDGSARTLFEGFLVEDVAPHAASALQGAESVNLSLKIAADPAEVFTLRIQAVEKLHRSLHYPAVASSPVVSGNAAGFFVPGVPVKLIPGIPEVFVEVVDLTDCVPQHQAVTVADGIPRHKVEPHIEVVGPDGVFPWPGAGQGAISQTGLSMAYVFRRFLNDLLIVRTFAIPPFHIDKGSSLGADEI